MNVWNTLFDPQSPQPDRPQPFGYKQAWWVIAATNPQEVARPASTKSPTLRMDGGHSS
ncbi:MAG: hypothetical protein KME27_20810 [Lyngbya sp. HA4199-MV5]|nr:hypothetical protein [Lyngbya sp. HA4199-MV5]